MVSTDQVKQLLDDVLQIGDRIENFERSTRLLGGVPEFDSMAVVAVITSIEEQFGVLIDDDELSAETFETVGSLQDFISEKV